MTSSGSFTAHGFYRAFFFSSLALFLPAQAKLLLWYPFDQGSGTVVADSSMNGNHLSGQDSGFSWNVKSGAPHGGSIYFGGNGSAIASKTETEINTPTIDFLRAQTSQKCTIAFWANPDVESQESPPLGFSRSNLSRVLQAHLLQTGNCYFDVGPPGSGTTYFRAGGATFAPPGTWTHWAFVFDGTLSTAALKIYKDGTQIFTSAGIVGSGSTVDWSQIAVFALGSSSARYTSRWKGGMDDFALWDEAFTPAQITSVRDAGVASSVAPGITLFKATPGNIAAGGSTTLSWTTSLGTSLAITPSVGAVAGPNGSIAVSPAATTTYRLTVSNTSATATRDIVVGVDAPEQPIRITEFLADNSSGLRDEDAERSDWLEIHNPNQFAVTLNGWTLSDSGATWAFPAMQIEGGQYLVLFASDKDRRNPAAPLHTNFKLGAGGDSLILKRPDGTLASSITFPAQRGDISGGVDAQGNAVYFPTPTPGSANGVSVTGFVAEPTFSVARGFFSTPQSVTLACPTAGATIRYTTDGSVPALTTGTVYGAPIQVTGTTVLRAVAFKDGLAQSTCITQSYFFLDDVLNQVYPVGTAPGGWPVTGSATLNGQVMRYGFGATFKSQYTSQQLTDGLRQIPTISIVTDQANLTGQAAGIYSNAGQEGLDWERPSSAEYINADGTPGFQINCGLRIRGGASRGDNYPKHGFRLFFRSTYGADSLTFPLHGTGGTSGFESIDLRTEQNYHYANSTSDQNTAVHEVFSRDLQVAVGKPTTRSRSVQLYVNGQYWGLYMTEERAQQDYGATYFGGSDDDYDVVQTAGSSGGYFYDLSNGTVDAWQATWNLARACATNPTNENYFKLLGRNASGARDTALPVYIDPEGLAGTMLLYYYLGDGDAPLSTFIGNNRANNWRGMRSRTANQPWTFFVHDAEHSMLTSGWVDQRVSRFVTRLNDPNRANFLYSNPEWIYEDLATNPEFRLKIADVAQKYFLNNGPLTTARTLPMFNARAAEIDKAIIPDIARWGQSAINHTYAKWTSRLDAVRAGFFNSSPVSRADSIITQLKARSFYPAASPPTFSQRGGGVSNGYPLALGVPPGQTGMIYATTDGSDPRLVGGSPSVPPYAGPIPITSAMTVRARFLSTSNEWSALDEATFTTGLIASAGNLVVSKINYHSTNPSPTETTAGFVSDDDFDYIELMNIGVDSLDLSAVTFSGAVTFTFAGSAVVSLAPGARVLVVANVPAFAMRYGPGLPVAGAYAGRLRNSNNSIQVSGAGGIIVNASYFDSAGWPGAADGDGGALVLKQPATNPDPGLAASWRQSTLLAANPGTVDPDPTPIRIWQFANFPDSDVYNASMESAVWGDHADPDTDGLVNLLEFALGGNPNVSSTSPRPKVEILGGAIALTYSRPKTALSELTFTVEASDNQVSWSGTGITGQIVSEDDTTQQLRASAPINGSRKFLRLRVTRP